MAKKSNIKFRNSLGGRVLAGTLSLAQLLALAGCPTDTPNPTPVQEPDPDPVTDPDPITDPKPWETITFGEGLNEDWKAALRDKWAEYLGYPVFLELVENKYESIKFQTGDETKATANKDAGTLVVEIRLATFKDTPLENAAEAVIGGNVIFALQAAQALLKNKINAAYLASGNGTADGGKANVRLL